MRIHSVELVGVFETGIRHRVENSCLLLLFAQVRSVKLKDLIYLPSYGLYGIQRCHGFLEDHRDLAAPDLRHVLLAHVRKALPVKENVASGDQRGIRSNTEDRERGEALSGARFANDTEDLALLQVEADAFYDFIHTVFIYESDMQFAQRQPCIF